MNLKLNIKLLSPANPGSGEGWAGLIDSDVVFDTYGVPFIPARRIRGLLRDSTLDVINALNLCDKNKNIPFAQIDADFLFGKRGMKASAPLTIDNGYLAGHNESISWLKWAQQVAPHLASRDRVIGSFTHLRQQTAIDPIRNAAKKHSLRTTRVLNTGLVFYSQIALEQSAERLHSLLALAASVTRSLGGKRNRGFGRVRCSLHQEETAENMITNAYATIEEMWDNDEPGWREN